MTNGVSDLLLSQLSEVLAARMGLHFPKDRWRDLERGVVSAAEEFHFNDAESCARWLLLSPLTKNQIETLASHLTIGETYFFREKKTFQLIEEHILLELISSRQRNERRLRIWSAGCCTGEEPYSIAILLSKMISNLKDWNITILATDINPRFLQKASAGLYNEWSFRETPSFIKEKFFKRKKEDRFEILPSLKRMVTFAYLNLAEDSYPSLLNNTNAMDIILCRNVLMYFAPERAKKVVRNLYCSLVDGGWLIVSPSETSHVLYSRFLTINFPGAILYKKDGKGPQDTEVLRYGPVEEPNVSFQPPLDFVAKPEPEVPIPQETSEPLPLEMEEPPQPTPYAQALALYERGCYAEAGEKIVTWLSKDEKDANAMALLARVYANQGKLAEALNWCEKAIAADKLNAGYYYLLSIIRQEQGQIEQAGISLKRALYLNQNFVLAHFALGNLVRRQGKFKQSKKHFENVLSLLSAYRPEDILPESEGLTAGRLMEIVQSSTYRETLV